MPNENHNTMSAHRLMAALVALAGAIAMAGCNANAPSDSGGGPGGDTVPAAGDATDAAVAEPSEAVSILRADIEQPEVEAPPLEPLNATIGFPEGGNDLDEAALTVLDEVITSEQFALGGPIVLRAHSDSAGSDAANERASEARGLAVAQWLVTAGVDSRRIDVIVFGEQNPVEPNALPDGTPNEAGRAINRRVEVLIVPSTGTDPAEPASTRAAD